MIRKALVGLIIAVAAVVATPIAASAAVEPVSHNGSSTSTTEKVDPAGGMMPVIGLWAGVGVLGLTGGMVTIATISRKQKPAVSRVAAAMS
jgi:hypothetical protein